MRNASGLTAADLAHAQGFRECAEILSNAQNLQQNLAQSQTQLTGFCLNATAQNGDHSHPVIQGRSFLNGAPNRKRSFDSMGTNQIKKARTDGLGLPPGMLNGNGALGGAGDVQMESMNVESAATQRSVAAEPLCGINSSNGHSQPLLTNGCDPTPEPANLHYHHNVDRDAPENMVSTSTAGSQVEHQRSVKAEQFYDHALFSTMLLYHGS